MQTRYVASLDEQSKTYDIYLFGSIGDKVDGDYFARELTYIDREAELINLHINSSGGCVFQGMSIVSAIRSIATPVHAYVDGVAASMAAVIAVACDKVIMQDYAKMMIHNPYSDGQISIKQQRAIDRCRDMLCTILSNRGHDEVTIGSLMVAETWFSAGEAKAQGLCDEVITSKNAVLKNLTTDELLFTINNTYKPKTTQTMKLSNIAASLLNISAESTEVEISAAVEKLNTEKLAAENAQKVAEEKIANIEADQKALLATEAKELIAAAIQDGRLDAKAKASTEELFALNHASAKDMLSSIPPRETVASKIGSKGKTDEALIVATWDELDRNGRLAELKAKHPDIYSDKFNLKFGK